MNAQRDYDVKEEGPHGVFLCRSCGAEFRLPEWPDDERARKAMIKGRHAAIKEGWELSGFGAEKRWLCPPCRIERDRKDAEAEFADRTEGAVKRMTMRATARVREAIAKKAAEREKWERMKTRPVGDKTAKADSTLTKDTRRRVYLNEFDRVVLRRLEARQVTAADEWRVNIERAEGVTDREAFAGRVDCSGTPDGPSQAQIDALKWRAMAGARIGSENVKILDLVIGEDMTPREVGRIYGRTKDVELRGMIGMAFIRAALSQLADFMKLA